MKKKFKIFVKSNKLHKSENGFYYLEPFSVKRMAFFSGFFNVLTI